VAACISGESLRPQRSVAVPSPEHRGRLPGLRRLAAYEPCPFEWWHGDRVLVPSFMRDCGASFHAASS